MLEQRHLDAESPLPPEPVSRRGVALLKDPLLNKGSAFTYEERDALGLVGLLPAQVNTIEQQLDRVRDQFDRKPDAMAKNIYLNGLMDRNETLFYRFVVENLDETVPIIYTPTVAHVCRHWSRIFRRARGIFLTPRLRGRFVEALQNRPAGERPVIVVTDNERILGIGDQGAGGMGIPIGKLALYAAAAGIHPSRLVPVSLDVGTNNPELLADPLYLGHREPRLRGPAYDDFVAEFVDAVRRVYPGSLLQWEDFANTTSFHNLERYRKVLPSFNDDIQGTAAMVVAGLMAAMRRTGERLRDQVVVVVGAGSAGIGIRDQVAAAMRVDGADDVERRILVLDSRGLIVEGRPDLTPAKRRLAVSTDVIAGWHIDDHPIGLLDVVKNARASALVGVSGRPGLFDREVITRLAMSTPHPIVMPLSNPTSHAEVTPASAVEWTHGRAIVATGSPFPDVEYQGRRIEVGQANNVFIFPGMGLGALTVGAREVTDGMFLAAARALAETVDDAALRAGRLFPPISRVRETSYVVALAVARAAISEAVAEPMADLEDRLRAEMWFPAYPAYVPA